MSLRFTGKEVDTLTGKNLQAVDTIDAAKIVVEISFEVIRDFGLDEAKSVACDKYSSKKFASNGNIVVRTTDFV